jgi:hypothetical protein
MEKIMSTISINFVVVVVIIIKTTSTIWGLTQLKKECIIE